MTTTKERQRQVQLYRERIFLYLSHRGIRLSHTSDTAGGD